MQVRVPENLQGRVLHSATAISHSPGLVEVILFGGCPKYPSNFKTEDDFLKTANTTVLRFGEYFPVFQTYVAL